MLARVSHLEAFRRWRENEDSTVEDLVRFVTVDEPSEAMKAGTAFHKVLELAGEGEFPTLSANGYTFHLPDAEIALPDIRELRAYGEYGGLIVTGQVDGLHGGVVIDHKTTGYFDADRYLSGYQWRYYLDLFDASSFRWNVFEIKEIAPQEYQVSAPHVLTAYCYPGLHEDCARLAAEYFDFARIHLADAPEPPLRVSDLPPSARVLLAG